MFLPVHFNPKQLTTNVKLIVRILCHHSLDVTDMGKSPNGYMTSTNWSCEIIPSCGSPQIPFLTSLYTHPLHMYWFGLYFMKKLSGIVLS